MPLKPPPQNLLAEPERERDRGRGWLFWWMRAALHVSLLEAKVSDLERSISVREDVEHILAHQSGGRPQGELHCSASNNPLWEAHWLPGVYRPGCRRRACNERRRSLTGCRAGGHCQDAS